MDIKKYLFYLPKEENKFVLNVDEKKLCKESKSDTYKFLKVSKNLKENLDVVKQAFSVPINFDFVIREFKINLFGKLTDGFLVFFDGLVKADYINRDILNPLMKGDLQNTGENENSVKNQSVEDAVYTRLITQAPLDKKTNMGEIFEMVDFGNCAVFVDGAECAFVADVKGWNGRDVGKPITEAVLSGPQEAFNEKIMTNIGLIRKILKDSNVVSEKISVGKRSQTPCALMYINGITNKNLVCEVRKRLEEISLDYVFSSADIEMMAEDSASFPLPQIIKTERPDRAASHLADGKVVVIVQGSPFVLVVPGTAKDLIEASEDNYVRMAEANFMRCVRILGIVLALFLPGAFAAAALYHHESLPTDLLFAIEATREQMPFSVAAELVVMIISFELIKEASVRIPDPIGSTLGIVGGLILGQAAVSAGIASPMLIIVVSVAGLGAFAVPSLSLSRAISVLQLVFVFLGWGAGVFGIAFGIYLSAICLGGQNSFGVPFLSSGDGKKGGLFKSFMLIKPIWKREIRPTNLGVEEKRKQPHISRKWKYGKKD